MGNGDAKPDAEGRLSAPPVSSRFLTARAIARRGK